MWQAQCSCQGWSKFGDEAGQPTGPDPATTAMGEDVQLLLRTAAQKVNDVMATMIGRDLCCRRRAS